MRGRSQGLASLGGADLIGPKLINVEMGAGLSYPTVDLSGKVAIITGGNTGIGSETAKALARMGAHTIIACRSEERATAVSGLRVYTKSPDHCTTFF